MMGHVTYSADDAARHAKGGSSDARASFDKAGLADRVVMSGGVHLNEQVRVASVPLKDVWSERELNAAAVEIGLVADAAGKSRPRDVRASGDARLKVVDAAKDGKGSRSSSMAAEVLTATFIQASEGARLDEVKGDGRTTLERVSETGAVETGTGDALEVHFLSAPPKASARKSSDTGFAGADIASALQQGHVVVTRKAPRAKGDAGVPQTDRATAEKASFDGGTGMLTLSGDVQLANPEGSLSAERVAVEQKTGDATADGSVKASYRQGAGAVVHVLAQRAELKKASGTAFFHGGAGKLARLWQGGSQVEAPVLEFNQKQRRLVAKGDGTGAPMAVHTVLVSTGQISTKPAQLDAGKAGDPAKATAALRRPAVVRVASREMVYSDEAREADFTGGVRVESADGVMRGDRASAYLQTGSVDKAAAKKVDTNAGFLGGSVERVTVSGGIEIDQQGRRATGDKLVYTASDGLFVLTGTPAAPPRVVDQARGAVTGVELQFRAEDESVVISNGDKGGTGQRVHTETRVKRDR
jgi:lipopolysaccharide export system protein LptA